MKILICTGLYHPDIGGPATYSKLLFDELPKKGIDVEILSFGEVRKYPKILRHFLYFIKTILIAKNMDIIFAQDPVSVGLPACIASKIVRKKFILKVVGDYAWEQQQQQRKDSEFITPEDFQTEKFDFVTEIRKKIERRVAKRADQVITPSNYLKDIVLKWGVKEENIKVVYNAFSIDLSLKEKGEIKTDLQMGSFNIISVGRLVPWKGFDLLIDSVENLSMKIPNLNLYIAGSGPDWDKLENKIKRLGLEDKVKLLGQLDQKKLLEYIKASDIFVLNTGYEGLSHQLLEVMSVGTPIITTNIGGNPEVITNEEEGILIEYNNKEMLENAILSLVDNPSLSENYTTNAREKLKDFDKEKMLSSITNILLNIS